MKWLCVVLALCALLTACGNDDDDDDEILSPEPVDPTIEWLGIWNLETFDGSSIETGITAAFKDDPDTRAASTKNSLIFTEHDTWFWNYGLQIVTTLSEGLTLTLDVDFQLDGTYFVSASSASLVLRDVTVVLKPEDLWAQAGANPAELEDILRDAFSDVAFVSWHLDGRRLIVGDFAFTRQ